MTQARISPSVQRTNKWPELKALILDWQPPHPLFMNNFKWAQEIADAGLAPIHRRFTGGTALGKEGEYHNRHSPEHVWAALSDEFDSRIWINVGNEAQLPKDAIRVDWDKLALWYIRIMELAVETNQPVVLPNLGMGFGKREWFDAGWFDEFIQALAKHKSHVKLGLHEYTAVSMRLGMGQFSLWGALNQSAMFFDELSWRSFWDHGRDANGELPPYWYLGRIYWWHIRAREIGAIPIDGWLNICVTEFGYDDIPDARNTAIHGPGPNGEPDILTAIADKWGSNYSPNIRGWHSLKAYKEWLYEMSVEDVTMKEVEWVDQKFYAPGAVDSLNWFVITTPGKKDAGDWDWYGFNYYPSDLIHKFVSYAKAHRSDPNGTPLPEPPEPPTEPPTPPTAPLDWLAELSQIEQAEVELARFYSANLNHGTDLHLAYNVIDKLAAMLDRLTDV